MIANRQVLTSEHPGAGTGLMCTACQYNITTAQERLDHYRNDWHRYNIKRRCAGLAPVSNEEFASKVAELRSVKPGSSEPDKTKCEPCKKEFQNEAAYQRHLDSKVHKKKVQKKLSRNSLSSARGKEEVVEDEAEDESNQVEEADKQPATQSAPQPAIQSAAPLPENKEVQAAEEVEERSEGEGEGDEGEEFGEAIPLKHCLFCPQNFEQIPQSLDHMLKIHGFFIPFADYLSDVEGLLEYLGAKVGMGHVCLFCNGRGRKAFPSLHAVQQHMSAKSHCKLRLETAEEEDELLEFYNFPEENNERAHVVDVSSLGELVVSDGSIIGHRGLGRLYRQNPRPSESRYSVLLTQMLASRRAVETNPGGPRRSGVVLYSERQARKEGLSGKAREDTRRLNKQHMRVGIQNNAPRNLRYHAPSLF